MAPIVQQRHDYNIQKRLDDNVYVVRRKSDNVQLLGSRWDNSVVTPAFSDLLSRGTKGALSSLLNHTNLINYTDTVADNILQGRATGTGVSSQRMLLWDFCDAGTLSNLFNEQPVLPVTTGPDNDQVVVHFLPEGLCWHVLLSVLKALSWLHEGHRDETRLTMPSGARTADDWYSEPDWLPVLHRGVQPDNIFFQHPRGIETYGLCKLGNYSSCAVSNHVNNHSIGQVVSATRGDESLVTLRANMASNNMLSIEAVSRAFPGAFAFGSLGSGLKLTRATAVKQDQRPYTKATELFQLGSVVYEMMSTYPVPDPEGPDAATFDRQRDIDALTGYSGVLRDTVRGLLASYRGPCDGRDGTAAAVHSRARTAYHHWKANTPDGKLHRDLVDDGWHRQANEDKRILADQEMHTRQGQRSTHFWTDDDLEPRHRVAMPPVPAAESAATTCG
ncbi:hypothetical protein Daus18300_000827 [Diaporthe australafricana]|uniref:non-specific serine/threonine protein kinase n=1 Tax=Diaporthe australafricana TaxID=127596 RepID=A0ABR3Y191_9PEZI